MTIPKLRSPIVLVHGLFGFDRLEVGGTTFVNYFSGIPDLLKAVGNRILIPSLTPAGGVVDRARQLKEYIDRHSPTEPVHVIAHSLGGLDSRYMISCLGMSERVLSLTTLGTPHRGTSFADWGIGRLERLIKPMLDTVSIPHQAFYDLTRERCKTFNEQVIDAANVHYFSVAGRHDGNFLDPRWLLPYHMVLNTEGENDGVVAVESARYGADFEVWEGDHLSLVNWLNPVARYRGTWRDPAQRYGKLLERLADLGFA